MKRHHLLFLFAAFIAITSSAQKLDNLVELKTHCFITWTKLHVHQLSSAKAIGPGEVR